MDFYSVMSPNTMLSAANIIFFFDFVQSQNSGYARSTHACIMHPFTTIHRHFLSSSFSRLTLKRMLESDSRKKRITQHRNTAQCECVWDTRAAATHLRHNEMRTLNEMKDTYLSPLRYFLHHWIEKSSANIGLIWNASKNGGLDDSSSVEVRTEVWPHSVRRSHSYTPFR